MQYIDKLFVRRPGLLPSLAFVAGTAAGFTIQPEPQAVISYSICIALVALLALRRRSFIILNVSVSILALLAALLLADARSVQIAEFRSQFAPGDNIELAGMIANDPDQWPTKSRKYIARQFRVSVDRIVVEGQDRQYGSEGGLVDVRWHGISAERVPAYGERWRFKGRVCRDRYGGRPDRAGFYISVEMKKSELLGDGGGSRFFRMCYRSREACREYLGEGIGVFPVEKGLLEAIVLGYRSAMPRDIKQTFALTGTLHVFAISGSHITTMKLIVLDLFTNYYIITAYEHRN